MFEGYDKHKIPKTESFPVSRSIVEKGLAATTLSRLHMLYFWRRRSGSIAMRADYCGEQFQAYAAGLSTVTVYAVSLEEKPQIAEAIVHTAIPTLAAWLAKAEKAGNTWRAQSHSWVCSAENGRLIFAET